MPTTLQKVQAFDINKELVKDTGKLMQNTICLPISASYIALTKVINALVGPVALMKKQVIDSLDNNPVTDALDRASKILDIVNKNIGLPTLQISQDTLKQMNLLRRICPDFDKILPNSMKRSMDNLNETIDDYINDGADWINDNFALPEEITDYIDDAMEDLKDKALSEAFDDGVKAILSPLQMYRDYIKSCGILDLLKRLQMFEKCMTNPNGCNRPRREVYYPGTHTYNSKYYMDLFAINLKGEVQLAKLSGQVRGCEAKMARTMKKLDVFKKPIDTKD